MNFKNPLGKCALFATMSHDELEKYLEQYNGKERYIAVTIYGMTLNMCAEHVDGAIIEQQEAADAEYEQDAKLRLHSFLQGIAHLKPGIQDLDLEKLEAYAKANIR